MRYFIIILFSLIHISTFAGNHDKYESLDKFLKGCMTEYRIPGLAIAVVEQDSVVFQKGYGIADPTERQVTIKTPFFLGSVTKSFTAIAVLKLVEIGRINLDTPIIRYLPWFTMKDGAVRSYSSNRITLRQLLHHTSGISSLTGQITLSKKYDKFDALELQVRSFSNTSLAHEPGTCYEYANANYQIAGLVAQVVSGQSIEDIIRDKIFIPLKMSHSYTSPKSAKLDGLVTGYRWWFGYPIAFPSQPFPRGCFPSGFCISTVEDLSHYLIAQMNNGFYRDSTILSSKYMTLMHEPGLNNYAMGWYIGQNGEIEHGGHLECFGAHLYIDSKNKRGIALLINVNRGAGCGHVYQIAPTIAKLLSGESVFVPPVDKGNRNNLLQLFGVFIVIIIWLSWSFCKLKKWSKAEKLGLTGIKLKLFLLIPLVIEGLIVVVLFKVIPTYISVAFLHSPDIMIFWILILCTLIGWSVIRTFWLIYLSYFKTIKL
jgi:CubicO group peptidase (beta-lactamase class C family)